MAIAANLGFPRIGPNRELKKAVEAYWKGASNEAELQKTAKDIRKANWEMQKKAGIDLIPSNDFSFYDQVLDTIALVGAVPDRYNFKGGNVDLATYFAMARGAQAKAVDVPAMEMTKWFDTNYHYIVPEFKKGQHFTLSSTKIFDEYKEAKALGIDTKPVLLGPVTFLHLGKAKDNAVKVFDLLPSLLPVYEEVIAKLAAEGAGWLQLDEPALVLDLGAEEKEAFKKTYAKLGEVAKAKGVKLFLATYFGDTCENLDLALNAPVEAVHVDLTRGPKQLDAILSKAPKGLKISFGVVDGRNIWINDFQASLAALKKAAEVLGSDRIIVAPSCSLLHSPVDLDNEKKLDNELKTWLSFATQKIGEVAVLATALNKGQDAVAKEFATNKAAVEARKVSPRIHNPKVKERSKAVTKDMLERKSPYGKRSSLQRAELRLPLLPTTTIGSFPQTAEVRAARAQYKKGELTTAQYEKFLEEETVKCIRFQEKIGLDALVHGEFERNDMVEYFGEQLNGFFFTENGWVQSYGSRCVKPPVIFGDVSRDHPMTIRWIKFAQENTKQVMKGMLTGPVTILQWSFVRDDQPRSETCKQIGLAIRDEVIDLEKAGIKIIQIDEAALREGLPLRKDEWADYLKWAVEAFRLTASGVQDKTQVHTHMCYSEFNDIIKAVADMDADVISIETSRSQMELLNAFVDFKYPNEIGPGVYDIHSPRVPNEEEMVNLLNKALEVLAPEQIWVNPDCGLKTRGWKEVEPALQYMVDATKKLRGKLAAEGKKAAAS